MDLRLSALNLAQYPPARLIQLARLQEACGYETFWYTDERFFREVYSGLTLAAVHTRNIKLGTMVTDPYTRHPALTAMAIARSLIAQYPHFRTFTTAGLEIPTHLQELIATVGYTHDPALLAPVAAQVPDAFVDAVTLAGTVEDVATCVRRMVQQGIKHIMIYPQAPDGDVERVLTSFAHEVIPRVRA